LKKILLNLYIWPAFALVSVLSFLCLPLILLANFLVFRRPTDRLVRRTVRAYGWILVRLVPFMAPVTVLDKSGGLELPAIFVANHNSAVDPYLFGALPHENAFVTTWPFKIPLYKYAMRMAQYIDANRGWDHVLDAAEKLLDRGSSIILWPEGHRSRDGQLRRFFNGAFRLSCQTGRPIVPVCIRGTFKLMPPGQKLLTPSRISMVVLPPVLPEKCGDDPNAIRALKQKIRAIFSEELAKEPASNITAIRQAQCDQNLCSEKGHAGTESSESLL
jgi:1-acyl-sn-glycerol-3-phosphate acyltransferase